jgi:hypothetical protein
MLEKREAYEGSAAICHELAQLADQIIRSPRQATQLLIGFQLRFPQISLEDDYGMLCLPRTIIKLSGDAIRRQRQISTGTEIIVEGDSPDSHIETGLFLVQWPKLRDLRTDKVIQPLHVKRIAKDLLPPHKVINFSATGDVLVLAK